MKIYRKTGSFKQCLLTSYAKGDRKETYLNVSPEAIILPNRVPQNSKLKQWSCYNCKNYTAIFVLSLQTSRILTAN